MSGCKKNILVNVGQTLTNANVLIVVVTRLPLLFIHPTDIHIKHGNELMVNGIVITVTVNLKLLQNNRNKKMQIDSSIRENILEPNKYEKNEQVDVQGVPIIFLMVRVDIHNFIILANTMITIQWLTLSNYV
jgi:hypothetical protein